MGFSKRSLYRGFTYTVSHGWSWMFGFRDRVSINQPPLWFLGWCCGMQPDYLRRVDSTGSCCWFHYPRTIRVVCVSLHAVQLFQVLLVAKKKNASPVLSADCCLLVCPITISADRSPISNPILPLSNCRVISATFWWSIRNLIQKES